ncbi:MAG: alpha-L-fucosidase C-terminal domain-containing protein [Thermoproteota archaeon]
MGEAFTSRDIRFTTKGDTLYAIALSIPVEEMIIQSLSTNLKFYAGKVDEVRLLGHDKPVEWSRDERGLRIKMPAEKPCSYAVVAKIICSSPSDA